MITWSMRSPSTGAMGDFPLRRLPSPPAGIPPDGTALVGGLRMSQVKPERGFEHRPVMLAEVVELFGPVPPGLVLDATVGGGGHASAILAAHPHLSLVGLDADPEAVAASRSALAGVGERGAVYQANFGQLKTVVGERALSGALFDLGVSSAQLDRPERGFSYRVDAPLDMRMDPGGGASAADVVNSMDTDELARLLAANGEGRFARRIVRAIVAARPLATTGQLAEVVRAAIPAATRRQGGHPAKRVFQAIRIAVNAELEVLGPALDDAIELLAPGGRGVVLSYHSGEDRLVKGRLTRAATGGCTCPPGLPCVCGAQPWVRLLNRGARRPSAAEVAANPRAASARLRAAERLGPEHGDPAGTDREGRP